MKNKEITPVELHKHTCEDNWQKLEDKLNEIIEIINKYEE